MKTDKPVASLGVAEAAARVMESARHVRLDPAALHRFCHDYAAGAHPVPDWNRTLHFSDGTHRTANYVLVLDALNFSFWADAGDERWTVTYRGQEHGGYWALAAALRRSLEEGVPLLDGRFLADVSLKDTARILAGHGEIPMLERRQAHLREAGRLLIAKYDGRFSNLIEDCGMDAVNVAARVGDELASFHDVAEYDGLPVPFYKRAQIVAVDLFGTFGGRSWGGLARLDHLTAFADYKVPQVLRRLGVLVYDPALAATVDHQEGIPPGDPREVEIRAATVDAVQRIRGLLAESGSAPRSFEIDWHLWELGQQPSPDDRPYHRTRTVFY